MFKVFDSNRECSGWMKNKIRLPIAEEQVLVESKIHEELFWA